MSIGAAIFGIAGLICIGLVIAKLFYNKVKKSAVEATTPKESNNDNAVTPLMIGGRHRRRRRQRLRRS